MTLNLDNQGPPNPQGEYKVTCGRYYTVSGKSPQLVGVRSDIVVPGALNFSDIGERFLRFPLSEDAIDSHFVDTFEDVSFLHKPLLTRLYGVSCQVSTDMWSRLIPEIRERAVLRIKSNCEYQQFLNKVQQNPEMHAMDTLTQKENDFQLDEAWNIIEDLVECAEEKVLVEAA